jgi:hypothetical protein
MFMTERQGEFIVGNSSRRLALLAPLQNGIVSIGA